jgi:hypothetical protein
MSLLLLYVWTWLPTYRQCSTDFSHPDVSTRCSSFCSDRATPRFPPCTRGSSCTRPARPISRSCHCCRCNCRLVRDRPCRTRPHVSISWRTISPPWWLRIRCGGSTGPLWRLGEGWRTGGRPLSVVSLRHDGYGVYQPRNVLGVL